MLDAIELFRLSGSRMRYLTEQQTVIAKNIANADTPGYQAQDTAPFTFDSALLKTGSSAPGAAPALALTETEAGHIAPHTANGGAQAVRKANGYGEKPDGNTVSLEEQMVKATDVGNQFALANSAYTASLSLMKTAIDYGR